LPEDCVHRVLLLLPLAACPELDAPDPVQPHAQVCDAQVDEVLGTDGSSPVEPGVDLLVRFTGPVDTGWSLELLGVPGEVTLGADRLAAVFMPHSPLQADSEYTLIATVCGHTTETEIRTASEPPRRGDVVAAAFRLPADDIVWMQPAGLGDWLAAVDTPDMALILDDHGDTVGAELGLVIGGHDPWRCGRFSALTAFEDDQCLVASTDRAPLGALQHRLTFESLDLSAELGFDDALVDVRIAGLLDVRSLRSRGPAICASLETGPVRCEPCADGAAACVPVSGVLPRAEPLPSDPRLAEDVCR
jgi:hypothetical protein